MVTVDELLGTLTLDEKAALVSGQDFWSLPALPRIGLRSVVMSDGPIGVRGTGWAPEDPSIALPGPTALAASFDPDLAYTAGLVLGQEARRKGVHVLLAPTVNLQRSPLGGRHFECFSEDPLLTGEIAAGYVTGVQAHAVATTVKHLVGNDFETERMTVDVRIPERVLREAYLAPFERVVAAGAWGMMSAYNRVGGVPMAAHRRIQQEIVKDAWGFDGVIVSDWRAARDTVAAARGGLDVAMPLLENPWGARLADAVRAGAVPEQDLDDKVRRVLRLAARVGALDGFGEPLRTAVVVDGAVVAREVAVRSFVLARNENFTLPLEAAALSGVAVLGALAKDARVQGGGSAQVTPPYAISPLDGLRRALPGVDVRYAPGADPRPFLPPLEEAATVTLLTDPAPSSAITDISEMSVMAIEAARGFTVERPALRWIGDLPGGADPARVTGLTMHAVLTPETGGAHTFAVSGFGTLDLLIGGVSRWSGTLHPPGATRTELLLSPREQRVTAELAAGEPVEVVVRQTFAPGAAHTVLTTLGHRPPGPDDDGLIAEAVELAAESDVAVVVVGTTEQVESEGFDRATLALPGRQDDLVRAVAAVNPRTVVVVNSGAPVLLPWADDVAAVLLTWFPGQEGGSALADVLLGAAEPGGRLPVTWPDADADRSRVTPVDGVVTYADEIDFGYRAGAAARYPFGHGQGYTSWRYENLAVTRDEAQVTVVNTGARTGREVVQIYVAGRLAAFAAVRAHPGEGVTVRLPLPDRTWQRWTDDGWATVPGTYEVVAAHSAADRRLVATLVI